MNGLNKKAVNSTSHIRVYSKFINYNKTRGASPPPIFGVQHPSGVHE